MDRHDSVDCGRRALLGALGVMILSAVLRPAHALALATSGSKMPIGVVGSGHIGGTVGSLWVKSGRAIRSS